MNTAQTHQVDSAMNELHAQTFAPCAGDFEERLNDRLHEQFGAVSGTRGAVGRAARRIRRLAIVGILILGAGSAAYAGVRLWQHYVLYDITIRQDGNVVSHPKILTAPGQSATVYIGDANGNGTQVTIDGNGVAHTTSTEPNVTTEVQRTDVEGEPVKPANAQGDKGSSGGH